MSGGGTRSDIVAALSALTGVTHVEVHDCATDPRIPAGHVAVVVDGGWVEQIDRVLYEEMPAGCVMLGDASHGGTETDSRWFRSRDWAQWGGMPTRSATIVQDDKDPNAWRLVTVDIKTGKAAPGPVVAVLSPEDVATLDRLRHAWNGQTPIMLDDVIDLVSLRDLIARDELYRSENGRERVDGRFVLARPFFTPAQRAAVSAHWSAQLRAKIAAAKPEPQVVLDCTEDL